MRRLSEAGGLSVEQALKASGESPGEENETISTIGPQEALLDILFTALGAPEVPLVAGR
jgi:hypothetical protein